MNDDPLDYILGDFGITHEQRDRIEREFKVPVVHMYPSTFYVAGLSSSSVMPTDAELRQIRSFIEFVTKRTYNESYATRMLNAPLAGCGGHNTIALLKGGLYKSNPFPTEGWAYRRATWTGGGSMIFPSRVHDKNFQPWSLSQVLDRIEDLLPERWQDWKHSHAEVFA